MYNFTLNNLGQSFPSFSITTYFLKINKLLFFFFFWNVMSLQSIGDRGFPRIPFLCKMWLAIACERYLNAKRTWQTKTELELCLLISFFHADNCCITYISFTRHFTWRKSQCLRSCTYFFICLHMSFYYVHNHGSLKILTHFCELP